MKTTMVSAREEHDRNAPTFFEDETRTSGRCESVQQLKANLDELDRWLGWNHSKLLVWDDANKVWR